MAQWISTLNLALELPFDANEDAIWSKLLAEQTKFGDVFISTLSTIDIVRMPFIDYSFVKWIYKSNNYLNEISKKKFQIIQNEFQSNLRKRIQAELLGLTEIDRAQFKDNLTKLNDKINHLTEQFQNDAILNGILHSLDAINLEIKELEEGKDENEEEDDS